MTNVVIGWDSDSMGSNRKEFKEKLVMLFSAINTDTFRTDKEHIYFASSKEQINELMSEGDIGLVFCYEELEGDAVGAGSLKSWQKSMRTGGRIILVVNNDKYAKGKIKGLYDKGFYDCLFAMDFTGKNVAKLVMKGRTSKAAFEYYGLENYVDILDNKESDKKKGKKDTKKAVPEQADKEQAVQEQARSEISDIPEQPIEKPDVSKNPADNQTDNIDEGPKPERKTVINDAVNTEAVASATVKEPSDVKPPVKQAQPEQTLEAVNDRVADPPVADVPYKEVPSETEPEQEFKQKKSGRKKKEEPEQDNSNTAMYISDENDDAVNRITDLKRKAVDYLEFNFLTDDPEEIGKYLESTWEEAKYVEQVDDSLSTEDRVQEDLLRYYTMEDATWITNLENGFADRNEFEAELRQRISTYNLNELQAKKVFDEFCRFMWGYDIIEPYIEDESITDIKILAPDAIQIKKNGRKVDTKKCFRSPEHYRIFINHIARKNHIDLRSNAMQRFADNESSDVHRLRLNINTEYLNSTGYPSLQIRMMSKHKYTIFDLIQAGMMSNKTAAYLVHAAQNDTGMVFVGQGSAGKTSLMNTLLEYIPKDMSGICVQEIDELFSVYHKFIQFQQTTGDEDGGREYTLYDLTRNALLTDVDYFIIGEIKGKEAAGFTNAVYTGNRCWASVHGPSSQDALPRIADCAIRGIDYTREELLQMLTSLQVVVFLDHFKIKEISEVVGWDNETKRIVYKRIPLD